MQKIKRYPLLILFTLFLFVTTVADMCVNNRVFSEMENKYVHVLREAYATAEAAQNILVVRTVSGMAMAVAAALDALKFPEIVGCIAGDDTIFVAVHTPKDAQTLGEKIRLTVEQGEAREALQRNE